MVNTDVSIKAVAFHTLWWKRWTVKGIANRF